MSEITYNRIASQSLERLAALSNGLSAIVMTLLVLELKVQGDLDDLIDERIVGPSVSRKLLDSAPVR